MDTLLDKKQVAELLNISVRTLDNWIKEQKCPQPVRIGRLVRFRQSEVASFIEDLSQEAKKK